jgi:hypothetical protein
LTLGLAALDHSVFWTTKSRLDHTLYGVGLGGDTLSLFNKNGLAKTFDHLPSNQIFTNSMCCNIGAFGSCGVMSDISNISLGIIAP